MRNDSHDTLPASTSTDLWVGGDDYDRLIEALALDIDASGWAFDQILCLARGGMRIGDVLSRLFDKPLAVLATSSYRGDGGKGQQALRIAAHPTCAHGDLAGRLLLVDDLVDSGASLAGVVAQLRRDYPAVVDLRTAVLWVKGCSTFAPDYRVQTLPGNPWIHQPFERYDALGIDGLRSQAAEGGVQSRR